MIIPRGDEISEAFGGTDKLVLALKMVGQMVHDFLENQRSFLSDKLPNGKEVCALRHADSARIFDCFEGREALEISISDHFFRQDIALGPLTRNEAEILKSGFEFIVEFAEFSGKLILICCAIVEEEWSSFQSFFSSHGVARPVHAEKDFEEQRV